jgi:hypothetical protein
LGSIENEVGLHRAGAGYFNGFLKKILVIRVILCDHEQSLFIHD